MIHSNSMTGRKKKKKKKKMATNLFIVEILEEVIKEPLLLLKQMLQLLHPKCVGFFRIVVNCH